jgi:chromate transporter
MVVWLAPLILAALAFGPDNVLFSLGWFFSKVAVVTFGGAYAVLPYVAEHAVQQAGWLSPSAMKDGLALAETLPGPLVKVLAFVGYLGGTAQAGPFPPLVMGLAGAAITTWVTFVPSFIFILFAAPYVDRLTHSPRAQTALQTLGAAVIGVIANLAAWFGAGLFTNDQPLLLNVTICLVSLWLLVIRRWTIPWLIGLIATAGLVRAIL